MTAKAEGKYTSDIVLVERGGQLSRSSVLFAAGSGTLLAGSVVARNSVSQEWSLAQSGGSNGLDVPRGVLLHDLALGGSPIFGLVFNMGPAVLKTAMLVWHSSYDSVDKKNLGLAALFDSVGIRRPDVVVALGQGLVGSVVVASTVNEGATVTVTVNLSGPAPVGGASCSWALTGVGGSPANAADFGGTLPSGTINISAGQTSGSANFTVSQDSVIEPNEGFRVTISSAIGFSISGATADSVILNDDAVPTIVSAPVISGTPQVGEILTTTNGTWSGSPISYARQWYSAGAEIPGATGTTYTLQASDNGDLITVGVIATNASGSSGQALSAAFGPISPAPAGADFTISGNTAAGAWGTVLVGSLTPSNATNPQFSLIDENFGFVILKD